MIPESQIGENIKALRLSRKLTLDDLAKKTRFSKGYLSKVENSKKSPPVSTLITIAHALGVTISRIFGEEDTGSRCSIVKKNERQIMAKTDTTFGYSFETLAHKYIDKKMEPSILTIPGDSKGSAVFQHEGEEMMLVIEGAMRFFHGQDEHLLETGDCIYFGPWSSFWPSL